MGKTYDKEKKHQYYLKNKSAALEYSKLRYARRRDKIILETWSRHLIRKYWPTKTKAQALIAYAQLLVKQDFKCAICKKPETKVDKQRNKITRLAVDHDHKTGKVRGLLCFICNTNLGRFERNYNEISNYLGKPNA
jgi:hypothetical protein